MEFGVARVIVFAKDMERMASFYEGTLGLRRVDSEESSADFVSFDAGSIQLSLHAIPERYARGIEIDSPPAARESTPLKVVFRADDVAQARAELVSRGATLGPVREFGTLHLCDGIDPEGNIFQLSNRL